MIYINAAGLNTVTRQSPFEGRVFKTELDSIKAIAIQHSSLFEFTNQKDWYPDYKMVKYIDTLKSDLDFMKKENNRLGNLFSYFTDEIKSVTKEKSVITLLDDFAAQSHNDTSYLGRLRVKYIWQIDSLNFVSRSQERRIELYSQLLKNEGRSYLVENLEQPKMIDSLEVKLLNLQSQNTNYREAILKANAVQKERIKYYDSILSVIRKKRE